MLELVVETGNCAGHLRSKGLSIAVKVVVSEGKSSGQWIWSNGWCNGQQCLNWWSTVVE